MIHRIVLYYKNTEFDLMHTVKRWKIAPVFMFNVMSGICAP